MRTEILSLLPLCQVLGESHMLIKFFSCLFIMTQQFPKRTVFCQTLQLFVNSRESMACNRSRNVFGSLQPLHCVHVSAYSTFRMRCRTENQYMLISISILRCRQLSTLCTLTLLSAGLIQFLAPAPKPLLLTLTLDVRARLI